MKDEELDDLREFDDMEKKGKYPTKIVVIAITCIILFFVAFIIIDSNSNKEMSNEDIATCIEEGVSKQDNDKLYTSIKCYYKYDEFSEVRLNQKIFYCYVNNTSNNHYQGTYYIDSSEWMLGTGYESYKGVCE